MVQEGKPGWSGGEGMNSATIAIIFNSKQIP
jgi:hypothetical protein